MPNVVSAPLRLLLASGMDVACSGIAEPGHFDSTAGDTGGRRGMEDPASSGGRASDPGVEDPVLDPPPDDPAECLRLGGWNGLVDETIGDISVPRFTLDDGFEFVQAKGAFVLVRSGDVYRSFEVVDCDVVELEVPQSVQGKDVILGQASFVACDDTGCEGFEPHEELTDPGEPCVRPPWGSSITSVKNDLLGFYFDEEGSCWWSSSVFQCATTAPLSPPTDFDIEYATTEPCAMSETARTCYVDGTWTEPEPLADLPPQPRCGGAWTLEGTWGYDWEVTEDGGVSLNTEMASCQIVTEPLGSVVGVEQTRCACTKNPIVVTKTQIFATCECLNCK